MTILCGPIFSGFLATFINMINSYILVLIWTITHKLLQLLLWFVELIIVSYRIIYKFAHNYPLVIVSGVF